MAQTKLKIKNVFYTLA